MNEETIVEAKGLVKQFAPKGAPPVTALSGIDISLQTGCLTAVIGPDGAGKTTLMRLIAGLLSPTSGELRVLGMEVQGHEQDIQNRLSYMPQKFGLYEDLTIAENMTLYANLHGVPEETRKTRFPHLLEMTGLTKFTERLAGKLSGGMKQKLGLACTLVRSPDLLRWASIRCPAASFGTSCKSCPGRSDFPSSSAPLTWTRRSFAAASM